MTSAADVDAQRPQVAASWLVERLTDASASGISATVSSLIRDGEIAPGTHLPTVRALARQLGVSAATVSAAWNLLRAQRAIEGSGRQGTWVVDRPVLLAPQRFENITRFWKGDVLDLTWAAPDKELLPDAAAAIAQCPKDPEINSYQRSSITPALQAAVESTWPWKAESFLAVNGGYEGILLLAMSGFTAGQKVAVADPSTPRILDILELAGVEAIPVACDAEGPRARSLRQALAKRPVAFLYEPRSSSRSGASLTPERQRALQLVLQDAPSILIIEDDGLGPLASSDYVGLGAAFPERAVLVRSYAKSHGPDLRLAVMGGAADPIERARVYRQFGAGWTSRILQNALAWMLTDRSTQRVIENAQAVYAARRHTMVALLQAHGVTVNHHDGLSIWVPVHNEQQALLILASHGIAADGAQGGSLKSEQQLIRLTIGHEFQDPERIAALYAMAATAT